MSLAMIPACKRCAAPTPDDGVAWICIFECTYCDACAAAIAHVCPSCGNEIVRRPRRTRQSSL